MDVFDGNPDDFTRTNAGDDKLLVFFYMNIMADDAKTEEEGRPIYRDTEFIKIFTPGDKNNVIDRPIRPQDKQRFAKQYMAFKAGGGEDEQLVGTRLTDWPLIGRAQAQELAHLGIKTVEQVADARDDIVLKVPGLQHLKTTAQAWIGKAKQGADAAKIAKRMEDLEAQLNAQKEAVRDLMAQNKMLMDRLSEKA